MKNESAPPPGSGATDREAELEKMLEAEVEKRCEAERVAEGLRRELQLREREDLKLQNARDYENGSAMQASTVLKGIGFFPVRNAECRENGDSSNQFENHRLRQYIRRQNALIDVLRRQKVLLEASAALRISERDFNKNLELHKV
ncbi:hypothetical protein LSCM4_06689 [Leishmania orientalis]|uniref:Uncharacterized protein n=1 Tax=Leishmania orientalis TaxID=2249476 RepID=A0A836I0T7_9TRYP|nr:hypothetical protein LSCM4_06689 [Leishmania orientalis]